MKNKFGKFCTASILLAVCGFAPSALAAKYSGGGAARQYSEQPYAYEKKAPPPQASAMPKEDLKAAEPITFDELRLFVRDWRKYARWLKTDGNEYKAVAYLGVSHASDYPPEVVRWMDEHGWATDRFFLLERKFRMTLSVQEQELKQSNLKTHMERQLAQLDSNEDMPAEQKQRLRKQYTDTLRTLRSTAHTKAPVTPEEYELIKLNREALLRVLAD
ncbi:MAG: hypothetical protein IJ752_06345 [Alphaproteobacteria bacterium]|nr:hypothetical protein [Alphaproteobacteria bacterium]